MPWITFDLDRSLPDRVADTLALIPGVTVSGKRLTLAKNARGVVTELIGDAATVVKESYSGSKLDVDGAMTLVAAKTKPGVEETLFDHQLAGVAFALEREASIFLWACGGGKTRAAALWSLAGKGPTIIVTKASVKRQFAKEIEKVANVRTKILSPEGEKLAPGVWREWDADAIRDAINSGVTHFVTSWEILPRFKDLIIKVVKPESVILDELHVAKSKKRFSATLDDTGKTRFEKKENIATAALDVARACKRRLGLTATFIANRTEDGWAQLDLLEPGQWGAFYARERNGELVPGYASRYCNQRKGAWGEIDTKGSSNLDELAARLGTLTHYVSDAEALKSVPPMIREVLYLDASEQNRAEDFSREINAAMKEGAARLQEVLLCEAAARKRNWALERAETALEAGQKVVLLTGRHKDCALLAKAAAKIAKKTGAIVFDAPGSLSVTARETIRDQYRDTDKPAILIGTREAWSTGIDGLQCTGLVINLMLPWTLERVQQTEGRFRRPGMTASVTVVYPICTGTYDERVARLLLDKLPAVEKLNQSDLVAQFGAQLAGDEKELLESLVDKITAGTTDVSLWNG
jgi:hypothetical protein